MLGVTDGLDGKFLLAATLPTSPLGELRVKVFGESECHRHTGMIPGWYLGGEVISATQDRTRRRPSWPGRTAVSVPRCVRRGSSTRHRWRGAVGPRTGVLAPRRRPRSAAQGRRSPRLRLPIFERHPSVKNSALRIATSPRNPSLPSNLQLRAFCTSEPESTHSASENRSS